MLAETEVEYTRRQQDTDVLRREIARSARTRGARRAPGRGPDQPARSAGPQSNPPSNVNLAIRAPGQVSVIDLPVAKGIMLLCDVLFYPRSWYFSHDANTAYFGAGEGLFIDGTARAQLRSASWFELGWATRIVDLDNDGDEDLFIANGHVYPQADDAEVL